MSLIEPRDLRTAEAVRNHNKNVIAARRAYDPPNVWRTLHQKALGDLSDLNDKLQSITSERDALRDELATRPKPTESPVATEPAPEPKPLRYPTIPEIQRAACKLFSISLCELLAHRRDTQHVFYRDVAMYVTKTMTLKSLPEIGRRFDGRDHTTVLHAVRKIEARLASDPELEAKIAALKALVISQIQTA